MRRRVGYLFLLPLFYLPAFSAESIDLAETRHNDGRTTLQFVIPAIPFPKTGPTEQNTVYAFLRARATDFQLPDDLSNLELVETRESLLGTHWRFRQTLNGVPIEHAGVHVSVSRTDGSVYQAWNNSYPTNDAAVFGISQIMPEDAIERAWQHLRVHGSLLGIPTTDTVFVPEKGGFRLVHRVQIFTEAPFGYWEIKIDAQDGSLRGIRDTAVCGRNNLKLPDFSAYTGPILDRKKTVEAFKATELEKAAKSAVSKSTVDGSARLFDPDPRTTLAMDGLLDTSSASTFSNAYVTRVLKNISETNGVYSLEGPWVQITNFELPSTAPSTTANGQWTVSRGNNAFNDAMTYYYIDMFQRYVQSLGFTNVQALSMPADSDGLSGDDNSHYVPAQNRIAFGHGGVDDNEDADVIIHEYGHALNEGIQPGFDGGDTGAIGEGFGDYLGGSYSYSTTPNGTTYHPEWAFSWDGHGSDTWSGRFFNKTNFTYDPGTTYSAHQTINSEANYSDQLWSTPVFQAFLTLRGMGVPREEIDRIVLESFFGAGTGPTMRSLAYSTVNAAKMLYPDGPHAAVFIDKFVSQSILPNPTPILLHPAGGEIFLTGMTVKVRWERNLAPARAKSQSEYSLQTGGTAFFDNMENGTNGWTRSHDSGSTDWTQVTTTNHSSTRSWFANDPSSVSDIYLVSPAIVISNGYELSFWHYYNTESGYDGGVVEASTNGSTWIDIGTNSGVLNGYNATISSAILLNSPIRGRPAFSGNSGGFIETRIPLANFAGKTINVRFRAASDRNTSGTGWWVDDVAVNSSGAWVALPLSITNTMTLLWTAPALPGTSYVLRMKQTCTNCPDSAWTQSAPFIVSADTDGDGLPDAWETKYFTNLTTATDTSDTDNDGKTDVQEYYSGTLPNSAASALIAASVSPGPNGTIVQWKSATNREYSVQKAPSVTDAYTIIQSGILATPPMNTVTDTAPASNSAIYRVRSE